MERRGKGAGRREPAGVTPDEAVAMSELLVRLFVAIRAAHRQRSSGGVELSGHAVQAILHLVRHEQRTVGELAEGLGVSIGWASRIADELGRAGYVVRERDETDRRIVHLRLSPATKAQADQMYRARGQLVARVLAELDTGERDAVARFLERLTDELEADASASYPSPSTSTNSVGSIG